VLFWRLYGPAILLLGFSHKHLPTSPPSKQICPSICELPGPSQVPSAQSDPLQASSFFFLFDPGCVARKHLGNLHPPTLFWKYRWARAPFLLSHSPCATPNLFGMERFKSVRAGFLDDSTLWLFFNFKPTDPVCCAEVLPNSLHLRRPGSRCFFHVGLIGRQLAQSPPPPFQFF